MIKKYNTIDLDTAAYSSVDLSSHTHDFFLIAITEDKNIKSISFSCAVDSGVSNEYLEIQTITVPVYDKISGARFINFPREFYIKPIRVVTIDDVEHTTGEYEVEININNISLH